MPHPENQLRAPLPIISMNNIKYISANIISLYHCSQVMQAKKSKYTVN